MLRDKRRGHNVMRAMAQNRLRVAFLFEDINPETAQEFIEDLLMLDTDKKKRPITIYLSSPGGYCSYGMAIADVIEKLRCPTRCIAVGDVGSMAPIVYVSCDERIIAKHSFVMLHPISGGSADYLEFAKAHLKNMETIEKQYEEYFLSKTSLPKKMYHKSRHTELWLTAEEAIKYGIAHKIM